MKATERLNRANGRASGDSQRIASAWIMGNSFAIALVLALFALWFAMSGFSWPGSVWQFVVIVPTTCS